MPEGREAVGGAPESMVRKAGENFQLSTFNFQLPTSNFQLWKANGNVQLWKEEENVELSTFNFQRPTKNEEISIPIFILRSSTSEVGFDFDF